MKDFHRRRPDEKGQCFFVENSLQVEASDHIHVKDYGMASFPDPINLMLKGAIKNTGIDFFSFHKGFFLDFSAEFGFFDEKVVASVYFSHSGGPAGGRH